MKSSKSLLSACLVLILSCVVLATGCGQTYFPDALPVSQETVDEIRNSDTLTPAEMRALLADYGINAVTINGLLSSVRLANQFGGDLQSAYDKVVNGQLSQMTPDEVQYYGDATAITTYTDTQAQAIVDFLTDEEIDTVAELQTFLDESVDQLPDDIDEQNLRSVFIETNTDDVLAKI